MKKEIKVKIFMDYNIEEFFIRFPYCLDEYNFVESDTPDIIFMDGIFLPDNFISHHMKKIINKLNKIPGMYYILPNNIDAPKYIAPFFAANDSYVRVFITGENISPCMDDYEFAIAFSFMNADGYIRVPNYVFRANYYGYSLENLCKPDNYEEMLEKKNRFCNFIYKQSYNERNRIFRLVSEIDHVDCAGRLFNNMNGYTVPIGIEKLNFMRKYKFTLAVENSFSPGYTTEKLVEAMLSGSIPIYYGDPLVGKVFNTKSFINYADYKSDKDFLNAIRELHYDDDKYKAMLAEPWLINNKLPDHMIFSFVENQFRRIYEYAWYKKITSRKR